MSGKILVINPGSTSTKIALCDGAAIVFETTIKHSLDELGKFRKIKDQHVWRKTLVLKFLKDKKVDLDEIEAVVGRGGLLKPVEGGTYRINEAMLDDLRNESLWGREHASNLGCPIAYELGKDLGVPAFTVDPITVDEMEPVARISGLPEIERKSLSHALNIRAVTLEACKKLKKTPQETGFILCHLGGGISVCAYKSGRMVDVNNALLGMGPFSPQRAGALPIGDLVELCYSGKYEKAELLKKLSREGGLTAYLGTDNIPEIIEKIEEGNDANARLVLDAMMYQISREIGAMAAVLAGRIDAIILTGGMAASAYITDAITTRVSFIAPVLVHPAQNEMEALASGALRVLRGDEKEKVYG